MRQIAMNAGVEGATVVQRCKAEALYPIHFGSFSADASVAPAIRKSTT